MLRKPLLLSGSVLLLTACLNSDPGTSYAAATLALPQGDPGRGRLDFAALGCRSCHRVNWDPGMPEPVAGRTGPDLERSLSDLTTGSVATAIVSPSHHVPTETRVTSEGDLSPMPDFTETMTVRQLIDVVAYLRSQGRDLGL